MDLSNLLTDDRFLFNLLAVHGIVALLLIGSVFIRRVLVQGGDQLVRLTGLTWLDGIGREATRRARAVLFWSTLGLMAVTLAAGLIYHSLGRDVRGDLAECTTHLTAGDLVHLGFLLGKLTALFALAWMAVRYITRLRGYLQVKVLSWLPQPLMEGIGENQGDSPAPSERETASPRKNQEETVRRWFYLLERYSIVAVMLGTMWAAGHAVGMGMAADFFVGFLLRVITILGGARLLTLAARTLTHALTALGNRHLGQGRPRLYWERVTRLFPFGERCFEAAVYVTAASLCIRELSFIAFIAEFGPRLVQCIGIFFGTRVMIELLWVLLNEAFGLDDANQLLDQKGQTLVPLLQSLSQYVLYFGSGLMMLSVMGVNTAPVLAGAGIIGLAVGLGAQNLVTDVVSGFFILFENWYLVGDYVKIGDSSGRVEAVSIRHTQIRDEQGKLHIVPNGQIKNVINYSKGWVNAEVDLKLPTTTNLEEVYFAMAEAGRRLRHSRREVLGETVIKGLVELSLSDMTVRAVTRVMPGTHHVMQNEYRRLLKEVLEQKQVGRKAA